MLNVFEIFNREDHFNTMIEIALHQISAADVNLFLAPIAKIIEPAVFEITPNNTNYFYVIAYTFDPRSQATHTAHKQIHFYACLRGFIEQPDKIWIYNCIHFEDKMCLLTR